MFGLAHNFCLSLPALHFSVDTVYLKPVHMKWFFSLIYLRLVFSTNSQRDLLNMTRSFGMNSGSWCLTSRHVYAPWKRCAVLSGPKLRKTRPAGWSWRGWSASAAFLLSWRGIACSSETWRGWWACCCVSLPGWPGCRTPWALWTNTQMLRRRWETDLPLFYFYPTCRTGMDNSFLQGTTGAVLEAEPAITWT